ncbi:MAG: hypothetical protein Q7S51_11070 [Gallionellaceae bacterium]|nr:hypothetical protein [Gallionellaceae bacterium]
MKYSVVIAALLAFSLTACGEKPAPAVAPAAAPAVVEAPAPAAASDAVSAPAAMDSMHK